MIKSAPNSKKGKIGILSDFITILDKIIWEQKMWQCYIYGIYRAYFFLQIHKNVYRRLLDSKLICEMSTDTRLYENQCISYRGLVFFSCIYCETRNDNNNVFLFFRETLCNLIEVVNVDQQGPANMLKLCKQYTLKNYKK